MPIFVWDEAKLGLGIRRIDNDHKEIVNLMNQLYELNLSKATKSVLLRVMIDLVEVTEKHFRNEEKLMQEIEYFGLSSHQIIHKELLKNLGLQIKKFQLSDGGVISEEYFNFLKHWLITHIKGTDRQYCEHLAPQAN